MSRCIGIKPSGEQCERIVDSSQSYCYSHDPANKERRSRAASTAAKAKAGEIHDIKSELRELVQDVLSGKVETRIASVVGQLQGYRLKAVELERRIKETQELEDRLQELEQAQQYQKAGGKQWAR